MPELRKYRVAGHVFAVRLEKPWQFMQYTPAVQQRIDRAAAGAPAEVVPVRAGDDIPSRTFVRCKDELPENSKYMLDFSQYEPFLDMEAGDDEVLFEMTVGDFINEQVEAEIVENTRMILQFKEYLPWYYVRMKPDGATSYEFFPVEDKSVGFMTISLDRKKAVFLPKRGFGKTAVLGQLSTAMMLMYTYATASRDTLLMHSSVVRHNGKANMFFGKSGTGKSTHARLWVDNIPGCDLINDDNPVVRFIDGKFMVYGTPWSGKTPCYRNVSAEVRSLVRLEQAPRNEIRQIMGIDAYANILSSSSRVKWIKEDAEKFVRMAEKFAMGVRSFHLGCLPDKDAALTSLHATEDGE